jgi:hypothetical protein
VPLILTSAVWRFYDSGAAPDPRWKERGFNDSGWRSGPAELGYGDGDERTVVSFGSDPTRKPITTYFRREFAVTNAATFTSLVAKIRRDDGAIIYVNGTEVWRNNLPSGIVTHDTPATERVNGDAETTAIAVAIPPALLVTGTNVIAVEVHQSDAASSDLTFDLQLSGVSSAPDIVVTRGPYLQSRNTTSIIVRWRTNVATDSRVRYSTSPFAFGRIADAPAVTTEHEVVLSGLTPGTRYYYAIGTSSVTLAGGDESYSFVTAPQTGTAAPTRVWVIGDSGSKNYKAAAVRDAYLALSPPSQTDVWLMLGDNAYETGEDELYQRAVFDMYPMLLRQTPLWSALGNHDLLARDLAYFQIFSLPGGGESGGLPSGTERYYSFDHANIHFVALDSTLPPDGSVSGDMLTWLRSDLSLTRQEWLVAFFHHPPYSKGEHDSDVEREQIEIRGNALPILEEFGVDVVLTGHSHSYERTFLIDSHYGRSVDFREEMKKDAGRGRSSESGVYRKHAGRVPHEGTVYVVAGNAGVLEDAPLGHPAVAVQEMSLGSVVLDVAGNRLDARYLRADGTIGDSFTIVKGLPAAAAALDVRAVSATRVSLQWRHDPADEDGFVIERCTGVCSDGGSFVTIATTTTPGYIDNSAAPRTTYTYRVRAYNRIGQSAPTARVTVTTPAATRTKRRAVH